MSAKDHEDTPQVSALEVDQEAQHEAEAKAEELESMLGPDAFRMARTLALDDAGRIRIVGHLPTAGARALLADDLAEHLAAGGAVDLLGAFIPPTTPGATTDAVGIVTGDGDVVTLERAALPAGSIETSSLQADLLVAADHPRHDELAGPVIGAQFLRRGGFDGTERRALHRIADPDPVPTLAEIRAASGRTDLDPSSPPAADVWITEDIPYDTEMSDRPRAVWRLLAAAGDRTRTEALLHERELPYGLPDDMAERMSRGR